MEIYNYSPKMDTDRMYCPSSQELVFSPELEELNAKANALIAYWHTEALEQPFIKDENLKLAWDRYLTHWKETDEETDIWVPVQNFLSNYENQDWIVYECTFYEQTCGPSSETIFFVVKADTIIEPDPAFHND